MQVLLSVIFTTFLKAGLPYQLIESLRGIPGFHENEFIAVHDAGNAPVSIRFNRRKLDAVGKKAGDIFSGEPIPWCDDGIYLSERPSFTTDPFFHAGMYYVQEASSMFLQEVLKQVVDNSNQIHALDLCAAPGGKSTLIQSFLSEESLLVSNEVIRTRVNILTENIIKWGAGNVVVTNNDPADFQRLPAFFDLMMVDAPCSGSGLFRRDKEAITEWSPQNVILCSQRQQRILADALPALKPGGLLIYSTCSFSEEEDEEIADWLMDNADMEKLPLNLPDFWKVVQTFSPRHQVPGYRFFPDQLKGEGFFITVMRKQGGDENFQQSKPKKKLEFAGRVEKQIIGKSIIQKPGLVYLKNQENIFCWPEHLQEALQLLKENLYIKYAGTDLGSIGKNELIPHHAIAMNYRLQTDYPSLELNRDEVLDYLRRNPLNFTGEIKGWTLIKYLSIATGFVKALPNRMNNYYPAQWRIINK